MYSYIDKSCVSLPLQERIDRLGYWLVNGSKIFFNKIQAFCYCTEFNTVDIKYQLAPDIFNNVDWTVEPEQDLQQLYQTRALQLREKYDYLVLAYSSGSDSINALNSFLKAGVKPDEIVTYIIEHPSIDKMCNANIEFYKNQDYIYDLCEKNNIQFTTLNFYDSYNFYDTPNWIYQSHGVRAPHSNAQGLQVYNNYFRKYLDKGIRCGIVYGLEKPNIGMDQNGNMTSYFLDHSLNQFIDLGMYYDNYSGLNFERFLVTGDMPEIVVKQSHIVAKYYSQQTDVKQSLELGMSFDPREYKKNCNKLLYPDFNPDKFYSIGKIGFEIYGYRDEWFWSLPDSDTRKQNIQSAWEKINQTVDNRWFNDGSIYNDTVGCVSDFYQLGITVDA